MTFDAFETADGSPVELLTFSNGTDTFRVANTVRATVVNGLVYEALAYTRTPFSQSKDSDDANVTVDVPADFAVVNLYGGVLTSNVTLVTIERFHLDDPDNELQVAWKGQVVSIERTEASDGKTVVRLLCQPLTKGAESTPPDTFSALCNSFLFQSPGCSLIRDDWRHVSTVSAVSANGLEITIPDLRLQAATLDAAQGGPTGPLSSDELDIYWQGGYLESAGGEFRDIVEGDVGGNPDAVRIALPFRSIAVGEVVRVFAGCDLTLATCHKKFDNAVNFQGFAYIPEIDPANTELPPGSRTSPSKFRGVQS